MKAVILSGGIGEPSNFSLEDVPNIEKIGDNEVLIRHSAIGINYDDIMYRKGIFPLPEDIGKKPILGFEAVGEVINKGKNVKSFEIGTRVGYAFSPFGAYAEERVIDYRYIFTIKNNLSSDVLAGCLRKGLTAEYLLFKVASLRKNDTILIHSAAGGVGHLMVKLAKYCGLKVIGTVGCQEKRTMALATGCDMVIDRSSEDIFDKVAEFTEYQGVKAVFDGIGKPVFDVSRHCLRPYGIYVSYGYSGGMLEPLDIFTLRENSLFFTAPTLDNYCANRYELLFSIDHIMKLINDGILLPNVKKYTFDTIPQAHIDLETQKTNGSLVAIV